MLYERGNILMNDPLAKYFPKFAQMRVAARDAAGEPTGQTVPADRLINADPTRADFGFGLGLAVRTTPGVVRLMGSVGQFTWPGANGTDWWVDPKEELAVVYLSAAPGPIRWHCRKKINALVYQAIID